MAFVLGSRTKEWRKNCNESMQHMANLVAGGNLLNQRQCADLVTKLTKIDENVRTLKRTSGMQAAVKNFYRCLEKAKRLVTNCGEREWWRAAAFQWQNENAFQEILLDASLCYHLMYGLSEIHDKRYGVKNHPVDLRQSSEFEAASDSDVRGDDDDLRSLLQQLVEDPENIESHHRPSKEELAVAQSLASYLLLKMRFATEQSLSSAMDKCIGIMWESDKECPETWGNHSVLGGEGALGVLAISTEWHGIPCFKKEFHAKEQVFEKSFLKEAAIMAHLKHPNIIEFLCCGNGQNQGSRFIGMELMEKSLFDLIKDQKGVPFSWDVRIDIIVQIARGMCYLHDRGVAHRDLKPHNVVVKKLITPHLESHWQMKLIDYGISKTEVENAKSNKITYFGIGTGVYRAPELHPLAESNSRGRATWFEADVYSFAMTCVHVLTLSQPFEDEESQRKFPKMTLREDLYDAVMNGWRPTLPKDCPQVLSALMNNCWNVISSKRPTFVKICSELEACRHTLILHSSVRKAKIQPNQVFIDEKITTQSSRYESIPKVKLSETINEEENNPSGLISIISCPCNHKLKYIPKPPYEMALCDICRESIDGEVYHCSTCQFDAHSHCAEMGKKVKVPFHGHPLQLLTQNFYKNDREAMCSLCEESIQYSEWVYRCERCEYDVHALCTKFPETRKVRTHEHSLTMRSCPPHKSLSCRRCNGEIQGHTWHYYCRLCAFSMHLSCVIRATKPLCLFDNSHRLVLEIVPRIFDCALCDNQGYSQLYRCTHCDVDIHPDCVDYMDEETYKWNEAYQKVMMERESKDVQAQTILILEILDKMAPYSNYGTKTSTHKPLSVVRKVRPQICKPITPNQSHESVDLDNSVKLQRKVISAQTSERIKAKKLALKKLREDPLEMLENLEEIVSNLQSVESASEDEKKNLIAVHERLKEQQQLVMEEIAIQEESKLCPGPRIGVFYKNVEKDGKWVRQLLTDLQVGMKDVRFSLLCEKPSHEHIVSGETRIFRKELGEETAENLKPLLACGLQIVRKNITSTEDDIVGLEYISIPNLEADYMWDLSALNKIKGMEDIEVLKEAAVSSSEWFLKIYEIHGNFKEGYGLQRIRYIVIEEGSPPCYKKGSLAWLCSEHFNDGLKEGILESYSSKYHNEEDDYEIRYPRYLRQE